MSNFFSGAPFPGFQMNEESFSEMEGVNCWFTFSFFEKLPKIDPSVRIILPEHWKNDTLVMRHLFAMIHGSYGYQVNPKRALRLCVLKMAELEAHEPADRSTPEFERWINLYAQYNVIAGTALAYQKKYVLAASCLLNGLKTGAVNLSRPYCDFIRYVVDKLETLPSELCEGTGAGFSVDDPIGGTDLNSGTLHPGIAEDVLSALEGDDGEIIALHRGMQRYGELKRLGSTHSDKFKNIIDVYEVPMIKGSKLYKLKLYFNGYFTPKNIRTVRLPEGFHLDPASRAAKFFKGI